MLIVIRTLDETLVLAEHLAQTSAPLQRRG